VHETAIADSILNKVNKRIADVDSLDAVRQIDIAVGDFRNVDAESLHFAFDALKKDFVYFENCQLVIHPIKAKAICHKLQHEYEPTLQGSFRCPQCEGGIDKIIQGQELDIIDISLLLI
jgi:hydrogenase nickel insertion protein HypA